MLKSLEVKDYALIEHINIEFNKGLNIITGETGAGKSILIDAMSLLLGERASVDTVRKNAVKSYVEGIFDISADNRIKEILEENEIDFCPELIMRREISLKGNNRCFINDTPVPLAILKNIGNNLVDLHGQHEHQTLLRTETHIDFLDGFAGTAPQINAYRIFYNELRRITDELDKLKERESILKEKKDFYAFQIKEIDAVNPEEGEEDTLLNSLRIMENSEKLVELTDSIYNDVYEGGTSVYDLLTKIKHDLQELTKIDNSFNEVSGECDNAIALVNDISSFIRNYKSRIDIDPGEIEKIRERLGSIVLLKKKYGGSVEKLIDYRKRIGEEFSLAENFSDKIEEKEKEITLLKSKAGVAAFELSLKRKEAAKKIESEIKAVLNELGIPDTIFNVKIEQSISNDEDSVEYKGKKYSADSKGVDEVEFFISTNIGEDSKPLAKVASGGEVSRIMLGLKTILAKNDKLPLLIFDEIDTGVSGRIALKVGQALRNLSKTCQIISITHLPQIAGLAEHHYTIQKSIKDGRVTSSVRKLSKDERVNEVAKLMSGETVTEASLKGARELIDSN